MKIIVKQCAEPDSAKGNKIPYKDWTLAQAKAFCAARGKGRKDGYDPCDKCPLWNVLCATEYPEKWNLSEFSKAEVEAAKAVRVLFPDAATVERNGLFPVIVRDAFGGPLTSISRDAFPSLTNTGIIKLDDIIGEGAE